MKRTTPKLIFLVFCITHLSCSKNSDNHLPRQGVYLMADEAIAEDPIMYVLGQKITDQQIIRDYSLRNIWPSNFDPPKSRDSMVSDIFRPSGRHSLAPSSLTIEVLKDGKLEFKNRINFNQAPRDKGEIVEKVRDYAIVETAYQYTSIGGSSYCQPMDHLIFATSRLDSIKGFYGNPYANEIRYYTERLPMRFINGVPEMYFTSFMYTIRGCKLSTAVLNVPHPDIIERLGSSDTVVMQISTLPFVRQ